MIAGKRVLITGGLGFLGQKLWESLWLRNPASIMVPRKSSFDLTKQEDCKRLFDEARPEVVLHLAAVVGGIGANKDAPGRFFYENSVMGINLLEQARLSGVSKFVNIGTICSYPKHTQVPFKEEDFWKGYPEETNAPTESRRRRSW